MNDGAIKAPVMKSVGKKNQILMVSVGINITEGIPRMFVLTDGGVIEFAIDMWAWSCPEDHKMEAEEMNFMPQDIVPFVAEDPGGDRPTTGSAVSQDKHAKRIQGKAGSKKDAEEEEDTGPQLFKEYDSKKFPLKEITFDVTGEQPDLLLSFARGGDMNIRFFDDTQREEWRRALAYYLSKGDSTWTRNN